MCGVAASFGGDAARAIPALRHRGPDAEGDARVRKVTLAHTRMAVLDLDGRSNQPFLRGSIALSYNGELWNFRELRSLLEAEGERFSTAGDTEVVAAALACWGTEALPRFEGMFAMAWTSDDGVLHLARDRFGEVPLHVAKQDPFYAASELKALEALGADPRSISWLEPGTRAEVSSRGYVARRWYRPAPTPTSLEPVDDLRAALECGATERSATDVPACVLLSGGLDSSLVAALMKERVPGLVAYVAVMDERSPDLRAAREVAEHVGLELREVRVREPSPEDLARVVREIEMPHKAQVEIGWACLALARKLRDDGVRVAFGGEGSDELWASYGFAFHGVKAKGWDAYRRDLFVGQHRKNFARCNKVFMSAGVECRLPFLSTKVAELALSLPESVVRAKGRPKAVLQDAVRSLLPSRIVDRQKLAFQDGLGMKSSAASVVAEPRAFYAAEFRRAFGEVVA